jgi:hypothetical protein
MKGHNATLRRVSARPGKNVRHASEQNLKETVTPSKRQGPRRRKASNALSTKEQTIREATAVVAPNAGDGRDQ